MARSPREHVAEDGTSTWRVRYRAGKTETSETFRRKSDAEMFAALLGRGSQENVTEALRWLASKQQDRDSYTFADWFEHYVDQLTAVTSRTRNDYRSMYRRYLSHLGQTPLPLITRTHVTRLVNELDERGLSPKTIKQTVHLLSTALALAVDEGHIPSNPCRRVRLPKQQQVDGVEARFLTIEEAGDLVAATPKHYRPLVVFLFGTGLRWSEATALQARQVNLEAGTVRVDRAWKRVPGQGFAIGTPKSAKSRRTVNAAVPALLAIAPLLGKPTDLVFTTTTGVPVRHANFFRHIWQPACERAGLDPAPRIHDARHSHASWLISDGKSLEQVQDQLGHESILTTRGTYGHLQPALGVEVGRSASAAMERVIALAQRSQVRAALGSGVLEPSDAPQ